MITEVKKLVVKHNEKTVGTLSLVEGGIAFQYDEEWVENGFSISPFSLPLSTKVYSNRSDVFEGLYGVFYDCLPDGWGLYLTLRLFDKEGVSYSSLSPLTKLSLLGQQSMGGLTFVPCQTKIKEGNLQDLDKIATSIKAIVNNVFDNTSLDEIYKIGGLCGGTKPKVNLRLQNEEWIIKFPSQYEKNKVGKEEYQANEKAEKCGIKVNEYRLFESSLCDGYFGCKRFDYEQGSKVHMISLSSLLETSHHIPNLDYLHLMKVTKKICYNPEDVYEAYRRMCFNVFYGNKDDHGRNFSFLYDETKKGYCLSPFYDITKTTHLIEHEMAINGNGNPSEEDLLQVAIKSELDLSRCKSILNNIT